MAGGYWVCSIASSRRAVDLSGMVLERVSVGCNTIRIQPSEPRAAPTILPCDGSVNLDLRRLKPGQSFEKRPDEFALYVEGQSRGWERGRLVLVLAIVDVISLLVTLFWWHREAIRRS
jgi:hypothetical protein